MVKPSPVPPSPASEPPASAVSTLTEQERFDLKCLRYYHGELARLGCGDPKCALDTCAVARHARLVLRGLDAIDPVAAPRPSTRVRKHT